MPVWVVDHDGIVLRANPAAVAALGYDHESELQGRHGHDTVHYQHPDGTPYPAADCPVLEPIRTGEAVHRDEDWFIRRDGTSKSSSRPSASRASATSPRRARRSCARRAGASSRPPTPPAPSSPATSTTAPSSSS